VVKSTPKLDKDAPKKMLVLDNIDEKGVRIRKMNSKMNF